MEGRDDHQTPQAAGGSPLFSNGKPSAAAELKVYGGRHSTNGVRLRGPRLDDDLRVKAFAALGAFARNGKSDEAAAAIIEALKVNQSSVALIAAYGTLRMAGPQGEAVIKSGIRDKDPGHRRAVIEVWEYAGAAAAAADAAEEAEIPKIVAPQSKRWRTAWGKIPTRSPP